jgi:tetratricopeptide (TPR) repeat protein
MQPPGEDKRRGTGPRPGVVVVGAYALEIGRAAGTVVNPSPAADQAEADSLAQALREQEPPPEPEKTTTEAVGNLVDEASAATAKVERAVTIGKGAAAGDVLDPAQLGLEADALLDLLERLDRGERAKEALRLARALSKLYSLLRRWAELLRALQAALRAGEKLGDLRAIGWAKHELGTLQLAGGDVDGAARTLDEAREIRRRLGDRGELAATEHNLRACSRRPQGGLPQAKQATPKSPPGSLSLTPALAIGAVVFVVGLAAGSVLGDSGGDSSGQTTTITEAATETSDVNGDKTVTATEVSTVTETVKEVVKPSGETEIETEAGTGETETLKSREAETGEPEAPEEAESSP